MSDYIKLFNTKAEQSAFLASSAYMKPHVSCIANGSSLRYNKCNDEELLRMPFTIETLGSGNVTWALDNKIVEYSKNGGSWTTMNSETVLSVIEGDEIAFKGTNTDYYYNTFSSTTQFNVKGNIMSLINGDDFETADTVSSNCFNALFISCTHLISAHDLKLPAMTLGSSCYKSLFSGCTNLIAAPELPATILANYCYNYMFKGCTSMTSAPELPATTLVSYCYSNMFNGCTNLNYIKALFTTISPSNATTGWVNGVAATGTFVKNSEAEWNVVGDNGVPSGWTIQLDGEELEVPGEEPAEEEPEGVMPHDGMDPDAGGGEDIVEEEPTDSPEEEAEEEP